MSRSRDMMVEVFDVDVCGEDEVRSRICAGMYIWFLESVQASHDSSISVHQDSCFHYPGVATFAFDRTL